MRTKEWWGRLTKEERSRLVYLEKASSRYSALIPDDCCECGACSTPHLGVGLCPRCFNELCRLIEKADGGIENERGR